MAFAHSLRPVPAAAAAFGLLLGAARVTAQTAATAPSAPAATAWLASDSAAQTVTLSLEVTPSAGAASALINGHRAGELQVIVPLGWTMQWNWHSADATVPHSLVVMLEREKLPTEGGRAAFSNAMTRMVAAGLRPGQTDKTSFIADEAGWYWILCGVPGHALNGEYIELRVDPEVKVASVKTKP